MKRLSRLAAACFAAVFLVVAPQVGQPAAFGSEVAEVAKPSAEVAAEPAPDLTPSTELVDPQASRSTMQSSPNSCARVTARIEATPLDRRSSTPVACLADIRPATVDDQPQTFAIQPQGQTCDDAINAQSTSYYVLRYQACRVINSGINKIDARTGAVLGTIRFNMYFYLYSSASAVGYGHQIEIQETSRTPGMEGTTVSGVARCVGSCVNGGQVFNPQLLVNGRDAEGESYWDPPSTGPGALHRIQSQWGFSFSIPGTANNPTPFYYTEYNPYSPVIRCDNVTPGRTSMGCVVEGRVPTITYSLTGPYPDLAKHIGDAQASGLPGAWPNGIPLNRILTGDDSADNRTTACPGRYTRPANKSCDEYPFATSAQGASTGGGSGRTFGYCEIPQLPVGVTGPTGYSACMINATQNNRGGRALQTLYTENRIIENDRFRVYIAP